MADSLIAHLLRRAGFGASSRELATYSALSYSQAVDRLVNYQNIPDTVDSKIGQPGYASTTSSGPFSPNTNANDARQRWLFRMLHSERPLQEKMTLFWHNYFATGLSKVANRTQSENATRLMAAKPSEDPAQQKGQIELFRERALGNFRDLLVAVAQDPAMLIWLDGDTNTNQKPQENFGREVMELFTRGVAFYTESDVYAAARVFTGWNMNYPNQRAINARDTTIGFSFIYNRSNHDTNEKTFSFPIYPNQNHTDTILARSNAEGMQDGIDFMTALAFHPQTARRMATRLYAFFVSETIPPDPAFIEELANVYLASGTDIKPVVQRLLLSAPFTDPAVFFTRYAWPAEFVVRAMKEVGWEGFSLNSTLSPLVSMGQQLLEPPDVAGWDLGQSWFSSGAMLARMNFAAALALNQKFNFAREAAVARGSTRDLVDYTLARLAMPADSTVYDRLMSYADAGLTWSGSDAQLQTKASGLVHLIVGSPDYQFI